MWGPLGTFSPDCLESPIPGAYTSGGSLSSSVVLYRLDRELGAAQKVIKFLIHEIIPRFGLPQSLQSDNGSAFKAAVTQGVSKALGINITYTVPGDPSRQGR